MNRSTIDRLTSAMNAVLCRRGEGCCPECAIVWEALDCYLEIQAAYHEEYRLRDSIKAEMRERGQQGELWTNGQCKDWDAYVKCIARREELVEALANGEAAR